MNAAGASSWADAIILDSDALINGSTPIDRSTFSKKQKCCLKSACPVVCFPCIVWSTIWRCLPCPIMCYFRGAKFMCSNNGCTWTTDNCIKHYFESIDVQNKPRLEYAAEYTTYRDEITRAFRHVLRHLTSASDMTRVYHLSQYIYPYVCAATAAVQPDFDVQNSLVALPYSMVQAIAALVD